jgi:hypothetical protein
MNNTITEHILNYRYKTNAYIALLNENNYFSPEISNSCSADILKQVIQSTNLIAEGVLPYPKSLVKRYQLNEQAGVGKVARGVDAAMKAMEAARTARELEAATKVGKLGAEAGEAAKAVSTAVVKQPIRSFIDLPTVGDGITAVTEVPKHVAAGANVLMNRVQYEALKLAQEGKRGDELAELVRQNIQNLPVFQGIDKADPIVYGQLTRVNNAAPEIIKAAEQAADAQKSGRSFDPSMLRDYSGATKDLTTAGELTKETGMAPEDIFDLKGFLKQEGKRLKLDIETGKRAQEAQPNIDWTGSIGMPEAEISSTISAAEKAAASRASEGSKTVEELSPYYDEVKQKVSDLNYELARRKAESTLFSPEELTARQKLMMDLQSYNAPKIQAEKEAAEIAKQAELDRITKEAQNKKVADTEAYMSRRAAERDAETAAKNKTYDDSLSARAKDYSQMTPEEQTAFSRNWTKSNRPRDREDLKTILQRADELLKTPPVPPAS